MAKKTTTSVARLIQEVGFDGYEKWSESVLGNDKGVLDFNTIDSLWERGAVPFSENKKDLTKAVTKFIREWSESLQKSPLLSRHIRTFKKTPIGGYTRPDHLLPWQAQAEKLLAQESILQSTLSGDFNSCRPQVPREEFGVDTLFSHDDIPEGLEIAFKIKYAQVYLWAEEALKMAEAMPLPPHIISRDVMPYPFMFWSINSDGVLIDPVNEVRMGMGGWILLAEVRDEEGRGEPMGISVYVSSLFCKNEEHGDCMDKAVIFVGSDDRDRTGTEALYEWQSDPDHFQGIKNKVILYGSRYPEDTGTHGGLISMLAMLNMPLLEVSKKPLPRAIRREAKRTDERTEETETNVVTLRRQYQDNGGSDSGNPIGRDFRWWVSGHIRAQWYPSTQSHKLIYIEPHLKGADGMPVKEKIYHVKR